MKTPDKDKAPIIMRRKGSGLFPVSQFDDEMLRNLVADEDIEVALKQRRSLPQLRKYWIILAEVVAATESYPSADKLHESLKYSMGYTTEILTLDKRKITVPDSIAFARMGPAEFKGFFDRAMRLMTETFGFDVLAIVPEERNMKWHLT